MCHQLLTQVPPTLLTANSADPTDPYQPQSNEATSSTSLPCMAVGVRIEHRYKIPASTEHAWDGAGEVLSVYLHDTGTVKPSFPRHSVKPKKVRALSRGVDSLG